uniref:Uncharacterized protein n=1 Tax=Glossina pallidipes TaxID=7398 RepID=A0A1A9Z587_GLOPL
MNNLFGSEKVDDNMSTCSSSLLQCKQDKHLLNICNQFDDTLIDKHIVNLNSKKIYESISETLVSTNQCKIGTDDTALLALDDESKQATLKSQNTWQHLNIGHSTLNVPMMIRKNRLLSLNPKKKNEKTATNQPEGL